MLEIRSKHSLCPNGLCLYLHYSVYFIKCCIVSWHRSGEEWRTNRSKLLGMKLLAPANVYRYCPGFDKVSERFIRNVYDVQKSDGFVEDISDLIRYWSLEGSY